MTVITFKCGHVVNVTGPVELLPWNSEKLCKYCKKDRQTRVVAVTYACGHIRNVGGVDYTSSPKPCKPCRTAAAEEKARLYWASLGKKWVAADWSCGHITQVKVSLSAPDQVQRPRPCGTCRTMEAMINPQPRDRHPYSPDCPCNFCRGW